MVTFRPTKHKSENWNKKMNVTIPDNEDPETKYICNDCVNSRLVLLPDDLWMCPQCRKTYLPEVQEVRKEVDFFVPTDSEHNVEPAITSIDYNEDVRIKKEPIIKGGLKALRDKGLKITSCSATDGAGRPMREKEEDDE